jgi:hypothetical protein
MMAKYFGLLQMHTTLIHYYNVLCAFIFVPEPRRLKPLGTQYGDDLSR